MRRPVTVTCVILLCLAAAGAAFSAGNHRSGCHSAHTCPSDHHTYVWYDAGGQGWDCAEPGAPEVTSADTQSIYYGGRRYLCHRAGGTHHDTCGVEAWAQKTLTDPAAFDVDFGPRATTVGALSALRAPGNLGTRMPGAEMRTWRVRVRLVSQKLEDDSDVHVVVADPKTGATMIVELPSPSCIGSAPTGEAAAMTAARTTLASYCGAPTGGFVSLHGTATIDGVAFFDFDHGQRGRAPNLVELHPVLKLSPGPGRC